MEILPGRAAAEVVGRSLLELYPDVGEREIKEYYQSALEGRGTVLSHALHRFLLALPPSHPDAGFAHMPQTGRIDPLVDAGVLVGTVTIIDAVTYRITGEGRVRAK